MGDGETENGAGAKESFTTARHTILKKCTEDALPRTNNIITKLPTLRLLCTLPQL